MAVLTYNGVTLPYTNITNFEQVVVYEEVGGVDVYLQRFDITAEAVINMNFASLVSPATAAAPAGDTAGHNAAALMAVVRTKLRAPRKTLSVKFNGIELIPQTMVGNSGTVDAKNGPQPQFCNCVWLSNDTFIVQFRVVAHYWEKPDPLLATYPVVNNHANPVLYNRWTESVSIDQNMMTRYTRAGQFAIRSDNQEGRIADRFRDQMAVVGVRAGMQRTRADYTQSPDGLILKYTVEDAEFYKPPPPLATKAEGYYTESTSVGGATRYGTVYLRLEAPKVVPQARLLRQCIEICTSKLRTNGAGVIAGRPGEAINTLGIIQAGYVKVDMYQNVVECQIKTFLNAPRIRIAGLPATHDDIMTATPLSDDRNTIGIQTLGRGTQGVLLRAAAYYDPSLLDTALVPRPAADDAVSATARDAATYLPGNEVGTLGKKLEGT